jgi:hypothetical protein
MSGIPSTRPSRLTFILPSIASVSSYWKRLPTPTVSTSETVSLAARADPKNNPLPIKPNQLRRETSTRTPPRMIRNMRVAIPGLRGWRQDEARFRGLPLFPTTSVWEWTEKTVHHKEHKEHREKNFSPQSTQRTQRKSIESKTKRQFTTENTESTEEDKRQRENQRFFTAENAETMPEYLISTLSVFFLCVLRALCGELCFSCLFLCVLCGELFCFPLANAVQWIFTIIVFPDRSRYSLLAETRNHQSPLTRWVK